MLFFRISVFLNFVFVVFAFVFLSGFLFICFALFFLTNHITVVWIFRCLIVGEGGVGTRVVQTFRRASHKMHSQLPPLFFASSFYDLCWIPVLNLTLSFPKFLEDGHYCSRHFTVVLQESSRSSSII